MYFKPVIVFGHAFYRGYGVTIDVDSLHDLDRVLRKALRAEVPRDKVIRFIAAVRRASYDGNLDDPEHLARSIIRKRSEMTVPID